MAGSKNGPKGMSRLVPSAAVSPREHDAWAAKVWSRMDRDRNGFISRSELDCEVFRSIIKSILSPNQGANTGGVPYERVESNVIQAVNYCFRKADLNSDRMLTFTEFRNFTLYLRHQDQGHNTGTLIFALFDLDSDGKLSESEFREVYRFYMGKNPTEEQFQEEWGRLDAEANQFVTLPEYVKWLQTSTNPTFRQHAPMTVPAEVDLAFSPDPSRASSRSGLPSLLRRKKEAIRPPWNPRFNIGLDFNLHCCKGRRKFFSRPQSLPELTRHYQTHRGFDSNFSKLLSEMAPRKSPILSNDSTGFEFQRERSLPGGTMRNPDTGRLTPWEDHWQPPLCLKSQYNPGTLDFRCPGPPPKWMYMDEDDQ